MRLKTYIPITDWLANYKKKDLLPDILAGLTIGSVAIPSGMAYGMLAGLPPIYGLYAALVPMFVYGIFGTSKHMIIGPAAIIALLVASGLTPLAEPSTPEYIGLVFTLTFVVGIVQFLMGLFRMGVLTKLLTHPVVNGFTSAASIIVFFSQLKHLLGIEMMRTNLVYKIVFEASQKLNEVHLPTLMIGIGGMVLLVIVKKTHKLLPGPLIAVVVGILVVWLLDLETAGVAVVSTMPSGLPDIILPSLESATILKMIPVILTITIIGIVESLVIAKALRALHKNAYDIDPDQEMRALGISNAVGAFFQAFPAAGSFSKTAVNDSAGARTSLSSIIGSFMVIITLAFLTPYFYYLPKTILASIIMVAIVKFIDYKEAIRLLDTNLLDFTTLLVTFLATFYLGIELGLLFGIAFSLLTIAYRKFARKRPSS
ncbi:MAG: SulP family inorganic anion transporter [Bacteroidota bacterium]